ncbi:MAG: DUF533 domain-containing protein [Candidatus Competibacteraceae bacterium]|nr:DUF533 domain-containing protein [Candidatus Competibacteraceae bacterium]
MDALQLLGSLLGNNATSSNVGGQILNQLTNSLAGGGARRGGMASGSPDLAGMLSNLAGGGRTGGTAGGGPDLGGLLGNLAMMALQSFGQRSAAASGQSPLAGLAGLAGGLGFTQPPGFDATQANRQAMTLVRAIINAAKADGVIDAQEQQKIVAKLSDLGPEEVAFAREEIAKPLNLDFLADVTPEMATQVYAVSLMAIEVDTTPEIQYLQQLAQRLGLDARTIDGIHGQLGLAPLYG